MRQFALRFKLLSPLVYPRETVRNIVTLTAREPFPVEGELYTLPKVNGSSVAGRMRRVLVKNLFKAVSQDLPKKLKVFLANSWASGSSMKQFLDNLYNGNISLSENSIDPELTVRLYEADPVYRLMGYLVVGLSSEIAQSRVRFSPLYPAHEKVIEQRYSRFLQEFVEKVPVKVADAPLTRDYVEGIAYTSPLETVEFGVKGEFVSAMVQELKEQGDEEGARVLRESIVIEKGKKKKENEETQTKETTKNIFYAVGIAPTSDLMGELAVVGEEDEVVDAVVSVLHHSFAPEVPVYGGGRDHEIRAGNHLGIRSSRGFGKVELEIYERKGNAWELFSPVSFDEAIEILAGRLDKKALVEMFGGE